MTATMEHPAGETRTAAFTLTFVVYPDEVDGGMIARCEQFPGLVTQGDTLEELEANLADLAEIAFEEAALSRSIRPQISHAS